MNGSHPRLSRTGEIVSGFGDVWCRGKLILAGGLLPQWLDGQTIAAIDNQDRLVALSPDGSRLRTLSDGRVDSRFGAGAGISRLLRAGEIWVTVDPVTGAAGTVIEHNNDNNNRAIAINGIGRIDHVPVNHLRLFNWIAVWRQWPGHGANLSSIRGIRDYRASSGVEDLRALEGDWEADPVPFTVAGAPWFAFISDSDIRVRPWDSFAGFVIETGVDQNKNLDAIGLGREVIRLVWNDARGTLQTRDLNLDTERRTDVRRPRTAPPIIVRPPLPPVPETLPMDVPNKAATLAAFWQTWNGAKPITDEAEKHRFTAALVPVLNASESQPRFGRKSRAGDGQPTSKDTVAYWLGDPVPTVETDGQVHVFDVIIGSSGAVQWSTAAASGDPLYANIRARWIPVTSVGAPDPDGPDATVTHQYNGGGNDTGLCDDCGLSRFDAVHKIPRSLLPHAYDGGEQDSGLCDVCQKAEPSPLHRDVVVPPVGVPPVPPIQPVPPVGDWQAAIAALERRIRVLEERPGVGVATKLVITGVTLEVEAGP